MNQRTLEMFQRVKFMDRHIEADMFMLKSKMTPKFLIVVDGAMSSEHNECYYLLLWEHDRGL